jgi:membrane protease YdiL (CAAX protease family)
LKENHILKIILTYFVFALTILLSAYVSQPYAFIPMFLSLLLLIPIYLLYEDYREKEKLSKEVNGRDKKTTLQWIFMLFILALSIRLPSALLFRMPYEKTPLIYLIIFTIVIIERNNISAFGFKTENIEKSLLYGFAFFIVFGVVLIISSSLLFFAFTNQMLIASYNIAIFVSTMPFQTLCVGLSEEGLFRGYIQTHLRKFYTVGTAILIQAAFFGVWHFVWDLSPFDPIGMAQYIATTFLIGLLFGYFYSKSKNIVPLIFTHGLYNSFIAGIIDNETAKEAFEAIPAASQILTSFLPYAISAIAMFLFVKYLVKEI